MIEEGEKSRILDLVEGNLENVNVKMVFDVYRENDLVVIKVINRFKEYLVKIFVNIINFLDLEIIFIGGGIFKFSDIIFDGIEDLVRKFVLYKIEDIVIIICVILGLDVGIIGVVFL